MAGGTPEQVAAKWAQNLGAAAPYITAGVNAVTVAPGQKAAQQVDAWIAGVQASRQKWQNRVASVSLQEWQQAMITKGVPRVASGAQAAQPKMTNFLAEFLPFQDRVTAQVKSMPKGNLEAGIARAVAQIRGTAQFVRGGGSRPTM